MDEIYIYMGLWWPPAASYNCAQVRHHSPAGTFTRVPGRCLRWSPTSQGPRWPPAYRYIKYKKFYVYSDGTHTHTQKPRRANWHLFITSSDTDSRSTWDKHSTIIADCSCSKCILELLVEKCAVEAFFSRKSSYIIRVPAIADWEESKLPARTMSGDRSTSMKFVLESTHTQAGGGEGREQGQPATTNNEKKKGENNNKGRKQAGEHTTRRQNKGRKTGGGGKKAHRNPKPWHAEEQSAQSKTGNKAKPQQRENWSRTAQGRNRHIPKVWARERGWVGGKKGEGSRSSKSSCFSW